MSHSNDLNFEDPTMESMARYTSGQDLKDFERERNMYNTHPERSRFRRKVGRNERCPCDSGKKFKKCCEVLK